MALKVWKKLCRILSWATLSVILCLFLFSISLAAFEEMDRLSARSMGMGGAFVAIAEDTAGGLINAAGLSENKGGVISLMGAQPLMGIPDLSIGKYYVGALLGSLNINLAHLSGSGLYSENLVGIAYGLKLPFGISGGVGLKLLQWSSETKEVPTPEKLSKMGFSADLGFLYKMKGISVAGTTADASVGLSLRNINMPVISSPAPEGATEKDKELRLKETLPLDICLGGVYKFENLNLVFDMAGRYYKFSNTTRDEKGNPVKNVNSRLDVTIHAGAEQWLMGKLLAIRGGADIQDFVNQNINLTFGFTFDIAKILANPKIKLDIAYQIPINSVEGSIGSPYLTLSVGF